jgi:hypothetical protein
LDSLVSYYECHCPREYYHYLAATVSLACDFIPVNLDTVIPLSVFYKKSCIFFDDFVLPLRELLCRRPKEKDYVDDGAPFFGTVRRLGTLSDALNVYASRLVNCLSELSNFTLASGVPAGDVNSSIVDGFNGVVPPYLLVVAGSLPSTSSSSSSSSSSLSGVSSGVPAVSSCYPPAVSSSSPIGASHSSSESESGSDLVENENNDD